ncbi:FAD-dependent oxidoreductase [Mycolicibacterium wolinskyi]|uniref:FAD-dependent oxidoreductase n=1 Tax=Mycolicibacterium wolinskyi TaxID=59750 RepID=UPI003917B2CC
MLTSTTLQEQYRSATADKLRILIVGAGIAGLTAAGLLRRAGHHPVVIERAPDGAPPGYMLALMPIADSALDDLGARAAYRAASVPFEDYGMRAHTGRLMRVDSMSRVLGSSGDYRGISRGALIDVLSGAQCPVTLDSTVTAIAETESAAHVTIAEAGDTHRLEFDLVVIADGIRSRTRDLVLAGRPVDVVDTRWGGWVAWAPERSVPPSRGEELWGAGRFAGLYPVAGAVGVFLGGPRSDTDAGPAAFVREFRKTLSVVDAPIDAALDAVAAARDPYYWSLSDCRAPVWTTRRTVLLGDAAAGFLPTAGIGAGMAMESAWVLCRMLNNIDGHRLADVLGAYERTQRPRVQAAQDNSRQLARLMFKHSRGLAVLRELAMRIVSVDIALKPIRRLVAEQPKPEEVTASLR